MRVAPWPCISVPASPSFHIPYRYSGQCGTSWTDLQHPERPRMLETRTFAPSAGLSKSPHRRGFLDLKIRLLHCCLPPKYPLAAFDIIDPQCNRCSGAPAGSAACKARPTACGSRSLFKLQLPADLRKRAHCAAKWLRAALPPTTFAWPWCRARSAAPICVKVRCIAERMRKFRPYCLSNQHTGPGEPAASAPARCPAAGGTKGETDCSRGSVKLGH